jgi:hypothetical protein
MSKKIFFDTEARDKIKRGVTHWLTPLKLLWGLVAVML